MSSFLRGSEPPPPLLCCLIRKMLGSVQCFSPHPLRWSHTGFLPSLIQSLHCLMFYSLENPHEVMLSSFLWLHSICRKSHGALLCFLCLSGFASGNPQLRPWDSPFSPAFHQESSTARVSSVRGPPVASMRGHGAGLLCGKLFSYRPTSFLGRAAPLWASADEARSAGPRGKASFSPTLYGVFSMNPGSSLQFFRFVFSC